ncbi:hypothetical protein JCM8202_004830 [Rhodotorula sphaerocarpa]
MQGIPIPNRPLCRTRRRSSSLSVISSASPVSPAAANHSALWTDHRSPSKPGSKRIKRARGTTGGDSPRTAYSPLKQSAVPLFEAPDEDLYTSFWAAPNPFALRNVPAARSPPTAAGAADDRSFAFRASAATALPAFCTSATDFALPGGSTASRSRHASADAGLSSSTASLASSKGSFADSSSACGSPPSHSLPSTSSSPHSPYSSDILAAASSSAAASRGRSVAVLTGPARAPSLRRSSSCGSPMLTDSTALPPVWDAPAPQLEPEELDQAEALHRVAFEQLRHATRADEESFVERMRRWEVDRSARDALFGLGAMRTGGTAGHPQEADAGQQDEDDEDEIDILLDPLEEPTLDLSPPRPPLQAVSHAELDELAQRLRAGACEVEDFGLVRDVQARHRTRTRSAA